MWTPSPNAATNRGSTYRRAVPPPAGKFPTRCADGAAARPRQRPDRPEPPPYCACRHGARPATGRSPHDRVHPDRGRELRTSQDRGPLGCHPATGPDSPQVQGIQPTSHRFPCEPESGSSSPSLQTLLQAGLKTFLELLVHRDCLPHRFLAHDEMTAPLPQNDPSGTQEEFQHLLAAQWHATPSIIFQIYLASMRRARGCRYFGISSVECWQLGERLRPIYVGDSIHVVEIQLGGHAREDSHGGITEIPILCPNPHRSGAHAPLSPSKGYFLASFRGRANNFLYKQKNTAHIGSIN